eukprot:gene3659-4569_t
MWIWRKGRTILNERVKRSATSWKKVDVARTSPKVAITPGTGIYLSAFAGIVPQSLEEQIRVLHSMPQKIVVVNLEILEKPHARRRPKFSRPCDYVTFVTVYVGFMDSTNLPRSLRAKTLEGIVEEKDATYFVASRKFVKPPEDSMNKVEHLIFD